MAIITVQPLNKTVTTLPGETVHQALARNGIDLEAPCNGQGVCGQCRVRVENPDTVPPTPHENLGSEEAAAGIRLACRLVPERDMTLTILEPEAEDNDCLILEGRDFKSAAPARHAGRMTTTPAVRVEEGPDGFGLIYEGEAWPLPEWQSGFSPKGIALDIGTTTLVGSLICLRTGRLLSTASGLNPQIKMGHDVMTRIQEGSTPDGLRKLAEAVRGGIDRIIKDICRQTGAVAAEILDVVIGGNTTMLEIAAEVDPAPLGRTPFDVDLEGGRHYPAAAFGFPRVNPAARVYVPPITHAFVGTDISAGMLVCEGFFDRDRTVLFLDVGTNGEIALHDQDRTLISSTAAGPAFEGMGVSSGMRARIGAVGAVSVEEGRLVYETIGDAPVKGICGSGIIDLIACLLELGVIEPSGRLTPPDQADRFDDFIGECLHEIDGTPAFQYGQEVFLTQKDIRQVQLAKGAIRTAVDVFIQETGRDIDRLVVAGGFGHTLSPPSLARIGLLPPELENKITFAGNCSLLGCQRLLRDINARRFIETRLAAAEHLSLAERPDFMMAFVENTEFPEPAGPLVRRSG
ncbi:MAG: ASKHA domain-containing protein [Desulfosudaceae bacterium]